MGVAHAVFIGLEGEDKRSKGLSMSHRPDLGHSTKTELSHSILEVLGSIL